jgi:hypothetical protein
MAAAVNAIATKNLTAAEQRQLFDLLNRVAANFEEFDAI